MSITMTNREKIDGGWSFVDVDNQPVTDPALLTGWSATFTSSDPAIVEVTPWETDPTSGFNRTFVSKLNGSASISATLTGPAGEAFSGGDTVNVISSALAGPVFTFGTSRPEA